MPVRFIAPPEPVLPAGESGHSKEALPKTPERGNENIVAPLPAEVEMRAKSMGESAGKLSVGAAMEIEAPDKPAGGGRKGVRKTNQEQDGSSTRSTRPRRVQDKPEGALPAKSRKP
jgi:hypothetical protein